MGPTRLYLTTGAQNVQALFRKSASISSDKFILMVMRGIMAFTPDDLAKFANDKTGRLAEPKGGGAAAGHRGRRYWLEFHHNNSRNLSLAANTDMLTARFYDIFRERVRDCCPVVGEWQTANLFGFMRLHMAGAATRALAGSRLLERSGEEDFLDAFWNYDTVTLRLLYLLPRWMDPTAWRIRERLHRMVVDWVREDFDALYEREAVDEGEDWHPVLGLRFTRQYLNWGKGIGLSVETRAGYLMGFLLG